MNQSVDGIRRGPERQPLTGSSPHRYDLGGLRTRLLTGLVALLVGLGAVGAALATDLAAVGQLRSVLPPGHYLVLFQNNAELRPSGGFIGSFATVDLGQSGYSKLRIDTNIYKRDNAFAAAHVITPPKPLAGVAADGAWTMRDSNWDVDFRDAAERVSWFYQQEAGEPVDGVIAVNATVLQDLLRLTGPIPLGDGSRELLSADTFFDTLTYKIEKEYFYDPANRLRNEPKSILRGLIPTLERALLRPSVLPKLGPLLGQELRQRQIQLFHTNPTIQAEIEQLSWGGVLPDSSDDFLLVNNASVGGQKSSLNVTQQVAVSLTREGSQTRHRVEMTRTHTGDGVWPDHTNNNYTRLVVPASAQLLSLQRDGEDVLADVAVESVRGKTSFGIHLDTDPGTSSHLALEYLTSGQHQTLLYQKQSGVLAEQLTVRWGGQTLFDSLITTDQHITLP